MTAYCSQSARDAESSNYGDVSYWDYLEATALRYAAMFPDRADEFMTRNLGQALAGNDGD